MNPFNPDIFAAENPCVCCSTPSECACALFTPPPPNAPYADYATAESIISNPLIVADCLAYFDGLTTNISSFSASFSGTALVASISMITPVGGLAGPIWFNITGNSGDVFTVACTGGTVLGASLYDCAGILVESISGSTPRSFSALAVSGNYYLKTNVGNPFPPTPFSSATVTVTSSGTFVPNPVIALWDDSGTTRQLEACPKMLLPPLTESTGDWYASCADADAVLTDARLVSNCVGYSEDNDDYDTFTATDGGSSLSLAWAAVAGVADLAGWGSVNAEVSETLSIAFTKTVTGGTQSVQVDIYDYAGFFIESLTGGTSPLVSSALPYTGRYIIRCDMNTTGGPAITAAAFTITSSGTLTVNPIQALYDVGLTCPARLSCGDSC